MISQIQRRIWESQLQVLFPIVESIRINLIAGNKEELYSLLKKRDVRQYGETIENPFDLEWGTLSYALTLKDINDEYYLKLTKAEIEIIRSFRDYRNNLAHGDVCSAAQVSDILAVLV